MGLSSLLHPLFCSVPGRAQVGPWSAARRHTDTNVKEGNSEDTALLCQRTSTRDMAHGLKPTLTLSRTLLGTWWPQSSIYYRWRGPCRRSLEEHFRNLFCLQIEPELICCPMADVCTWAVTDCVSRELKLLQISPAGRGQPM